MGSPFGTDGTPTVWNKENGEKVYPANSFLSGGEHQNIIPWDHAYIHEGRVFRVCYIDENFDALNTIEIIITPNATLNAHTFFRGACTATAKVEVFRGVTGVTGGTPMAPWNRNEESTNTTGTTALLNPTTVTVPSPYIDAALIAGGGAGGASSGGAVSSREEGILKRSISYLYRLTNLTGSNNQFSDLALEWYDHLPVGV